MDEKRIWFFGLVNACPLNDPLDNCPFKEIREKPVAERLKYAKMLPEEEVDSLIRYHKKCLYKRELKRFH